MSIIRQLQVEKALVIYTHYQFIRLLGKINTIG